LNVKLGMKDFLYLTHNGGNFSIKENKNYHINSIKYLIYQMFSLFCLFAGMLHKQCT